MKALRKPNQRGDLQKALRKAGSKPKGLRMALGMCLIAAGVYSVLWGRQEWMNAMVVINTGLGMLDII